MRTLEERAKESFQTGEDLTDALILDDLVYEFAGEVHRIDNQYEVRWFMQAANHVSAHSGQPTMLALRHTGEGDHTHCHTCIGEWWYWKELQRRQERDLEYYNVEWNPDLTF